MAGSGDISVAVVLPVGGLGEAEKDDDRSVQANDVLVARASDPPPARGDPRNGSELDFLVIEHELQNRAEEVSG